MGLSFLIVCVLSSPAASADEPSDEDFFELAVRPILVKNCIECHSAQLGKTSGGLALDTRMGWQQGGDSGPAIVPGDLQGSRLIAAIRYDDHGLQMPPEDHGGPMAEIDVNVLVDWVLRGAPDPREAESRIAGMATEDAAHWWAFQPLNSIQVPTVNESDWPATPIDNFLISSLEQQGLKHNELADRRTLLRRVTFDLTGLPPTTEQIEDFLRDPSPNAWEKVVDRLLGDPGYGERWGRYWLDIARYADTAGDGADYPVREAAHYRDWVIGSLNADQPYAEFLRDQIAGDIVARSDTSAAQRSLYADRIAATGFLAIGKRYGYAPNQDYQYLDFADCLDSVGRSILGLSIGCARCHDHKYDPITIEDYYALYGVLQSTRWSFPGGEEHKRPANLVPMIPSDEVLALEAARSAKVEHLAQQISTRQAMRNKLDSRFYAGGLDLGFESQELAKPPTGVWLSAGPNSVLADAQSPFAQTHPPGTRGVRVGSGTPFEGVRYVFEPIRKDDPNNEVAFTIDFRTVGKVPVGDVQGGDGDAPSGSYRFYLGRGVIESLAFECSVTANEFAVKDKDEWKVIRSLEMDTWYSLRINLDRASRTYAVQVGTPDNVTVVDALHLNPQWDGVVDTFICDGFGQQSGTVPTRDLDNIGLQRTAFPPLDSFQMLEPLPLVDSSEQLAAIDKEIKDLEQQRASQAKRTLYPVAYGVEEGDVSNAKVQLRGEPDKLGSEVLRRIPVVMGGKQLTDNATSSGRLELANWMRGPASPLVARVFVNRIWQWHFGQGLVNTPSDFGSRGERPSHPELLDYLANSFINDGWSLKKLHRTILLSHAYQMSSDDHAENLQSDPTNRFLWRMPRRSLDAESLRDAMLFVCNSLNRSLPPPHPFPNVDSWAFTIHNPFYAVYESDHRSVYLMIQRNRRHPFLALFDAADPNLSVATRQPTITPTQSLYLMNAPFVHQLADRLAVNTIDAFVDDRERIEWLWQMTCGKLPDNSDVTQSILFLQQYQQQIATDSTSPEQTERSAWAAFGRVLLTSNAFLSVD